MKTVRLLATSFALLVVAGGLGEPSRASAQLELRGVITDSMCGARHMMDGDDAKCVRTCIRGGSHYALLAGGKTYQLMGKGLDKLAGKAVTIFGILNGQDLVEVKSAKEESADVNSPGDQVMHTHHPSGDADGKKGSVTGYVRDVACLLRNAHAGAATTPLTVDCLEKCVRSGSPIGLLSDRGVIYLPISDAVPDTDARGQLLPYAGKYVKASGQLFERGSLHAISISKIEVIERPADSKIPTL
jgi:hypothetical protein